MRRELHRLISDGAGLLPRFLALATMTTIGVLTAGHAAEAQRGDTLYHLKTAPGQSVRLHQYARWDDGCRSDGVVIISVVEGPQGGRLDQRHETKLDAGPARVGATDCSGHPMPAIGLYYTPNPGFTGSDHFSFRVDYGHGAVTEQGVIDVR